MFAPRRDRRSNPAKTANLISVLFFSWLDPLMKKGLKSAIRTEDLFALADDNSTAYLSERLQRCWQHEQKKNSTAPSFRSSVLKCFWVQIFLMGFAVVFEEAARVSQPLLLSYMLEYFYSSGSDGSNEARSPGRAYAFAAGLTAASMLSALMHHPFYFYNSVIGMRMRIASCSLIYRKALRLSHKANAEATTGHVITLMSTDAARFDSATSLIHYFWLAPLQALVILIILWMHIGLASLAGYVLVLLFIPLQAYLGNVFATLRMRTASQTDKRVQLMEQVITGMKVIKMYCWEAPFAKIISAIRRNEMKSVETMAALSMVSYDFGYFTFSKLGVAACVLATVWLHGRMPSVETIVVLMRLMGTLQDSLAYYLPQAVQIWGEMSTTCSRIQEFLLLEEVDNRTALSGTELSPISKCKGQVELKKFSGKWEGGSGALTLRDVSLSVAAGELLTIVGPVGAGKSSVLMAILGELPRVSGERSLRGQVAYASQEPWILSATIRQNILFGSPFDPDHYVQVVDACDLARDIASFVKGDQTLVGERGVVLSGGQRARVGLARALYQNADVYLLDDPLSAVDAVVARHIFDRCIRGLLAEKACVLVTHQLQYAQEATEVLVLADGAEASRGTYDQLAKAGVDFAQLLRKAQPHHDVIDDGDLQYSEENCILVENDRSSEVNEADTLRQSQTKRFQMIETTFPEVDDVTGADRKVPLPNHGGVELCYELSEEVAVSDPLLVKNHKEAAGASTAAVYMANEPEYVEEGGVSYSTYRKYFRAGGSAVAMLAFILLMASGQASFIVIDWYLTEWSHSKDIAAIGNVTAQGETNGSESDDHGLSLSSYSPTHWLTTVSSFYTIGAPTSHSADWLLNGSHIGNMSASSNNASGTVTDYSTEYFYGYIGLVAAVVTMSVLRSVAFYKITVAASKKLHDAMFSAVVRAPMRFFDTNPVGRILNRFSMDTGNMDDQLPGNFFDFVTTFMLVVGTIIMAATANPWVLIPLIPIVMALIIIRKIYVATSRAVKRLEAVSRSPVLSHTSASLDGLFTVRAFGAEDAFTREYNMHQDSHTEAFYLFLCINRWFAIRLDCMCVAFIMSVTFLCILAKESSIVDPSLFALAISYAISMTAIFQWVVTQSIEVENMMTSVERIIEYRQLPPEGPLVVAAARPPPGWPREGRIDAVNLSLRYSTGGPLALKSVTFSIAGSEKVGVCGRTGAGKSSLLAALFRLSEPSGYLAVDGVHVTEIGLHDLRSIISIIPQDPVLFDGTVRSNLDPFAERLDDALWDALRQTQLATVVEALPGGLDAAVNEGGANLSVGQRQLLCLARALLRSNRILVVDEATANVDLRTSAAIQETIKTKFSSCTVLTVAHRLQTIMDSDRIMVMEDGMLKEFDEPHALLQKADSLLASLVHHAGEKEALHLGELARVASEARQRAVMDKNAPGGCSQQLAQES